jgi:hypothetical protein
MNDSTDPSPAPGPDPGEAGAVPPDQEELQRRLEQQLREIRVQDLLLESVASILNLSARRIGKEDERDLEQARVGIDAVRAVVELLDEGPREQVREALAQVQMLFVRESQGQGQPPPAGGGGEPPSGEPGSQPGGDPRGPEPPPRLWTPGGG